jgi:hypothetical protein
MIAIASTPSARPLGRTDQTVPARRSATVLVPARRDLLLGAWSGEPDRAPIFDPRTVPQNSGWGSAQAAKLGVTGDDAG